MNMGRVLEEKNEVYYFIEAAFTLDAPADFTPTLESSWTHRQAREVSFVKAGESNLFGDHFAGTRGSLVQFRAEGALGDLF